MNAVEQTDKKNIKPAKATTKAEEKMQESEI